MTRTRYQYWWRTRHVERHVSHANINDIDFSRLRVAATGAESVPEPMLKEWQERGILLQEVYGNRDFRRRVHGTKPIYPNMGYAGRALPPVT